jgi:hypothetical protein
MKSPVTNISAKNPVKRYAKKFIAANATYFTIGRSVMMSAASHINKTGRPIHINWLGQLPTCLHGKYAIAKAILVGTNATGPTKYSNLNIRCTANMGNHFLRRAQLHGLVDKKFQSQPV